MKTTSPIKAASFLILLMFSTSGCQSGQNQPIINNSNLTHIMKLTSPNFENNSAIPAKYTCQGQDISPQLNISEVPQDAKSLALIIDDPDAPVGNWTHWVVWNIPADTKTIPENAGLKFATQGQNSGSEQGYGGPCPPNGVHRYFFKLFALSDNLDLPSTTKKADLEKAMEGKIIDEAQLMGTYKKS